MTQARTYQTILQQLSQVPASRMVEVRHFLEKMMYKKEVSTKSYAGIWSDFSDEEFNDFQEELKKNRENTNNHANQATNI